MLINFKNRNNKKNNNKNNKKKNNKNKRKNNRKKQNKRKFRLKKTKSLRINQNKETCKMLFIYLKSAKLITTGVINLPKKIQI